MGSAGIGTSAKIPPATAVSPGTVATNLTTALTPTGDSLYVSAAEKAAVVEEANSWYQKRIVEMKLAAPGVSNFRYRDLTKPESLPANLTEAAVLGGGATVGNAVAQVSPYYVANPSAQPWAFALRAAFPVPASGKTFIVGFTTPQSATGVIALASYYDGGQGKTQYALYSSAPAWSLVYTFGPVIDGAVHDVVVGFDMSVIRLYLDGVLAATTGNRAANLPTSYCRLQISASGSPANLITDIAIGV
jgi:hypothetical protein